MNLRGLYRYFELDVRPETFSCYGPFSVVESGEAHCDQCRHGFNSLIIYVNKAFKILATPIDTT